MLLALPLALLNPMVFGASESICISHKIRKIYGTPNSQKETAYLDAGEYNVGAFSGICGVGDAEAQLVLREGEVRTYRISIDQGASVRVGPTAQ